MNTKDKIMMFMITVLFVISIIQEHQLYVLRDKVLVLEQDRDSLASCVNQLQEHMIVDQLKEINQRVQGVSDSLKEERGNIP